MAKHVPPLALDTAKEICAGFQHLIGQRFYPDSDEFITIENVLVSPFGETNKHIFLTQYRTSGNAAEALGLYEGNEYDILVIARIRSDSVSILHKDLGEYLSSNNIYVDH